MGPSQNSSATVPLAFRSYNHTPHELFAAEVGAEADGLFLKLSAEGAEKKLITQRKANKATSGGH